MKVGMVYDECYIGYELGQELTRKHGVEVTYYDFYGKYIGEMRLGSPWLGTMRLAWKLRISQVDLLHAHYCHSPAYACYFAGLPYIIHCHGMDIRKGINRLKRIALNEADRVLIATKDMLPLWPKATHLPTAIGPQFIDLHQERKPATLYFHRNYENPPKPFKDIPLIVEEPHYPYNEMTKVFNTYEYFMDRHSIPTLSKNALEALACGCKVIQNDRIYNKFPEQHRLANVAIKLLRIYREILE